MPQEPAKESIPIERLSAAVRAIRDIAANDIDLRGILAHRDACAGRQPNAKKAAILLELLDLAAGALALDLGALARIKKERI